MKIFTLEEANALIPVVRPKLEKIKAQYAKTASLRESADKNFPQVANKIRFEPQFAEDETEDFQDLVRVTDER